MQIPKLETCRCAVQILITCIVVAIVEAAQYFAIPIWEPALLFGLLYPVVFLSGAIFCRLISRRSQEYEQRLNQMQTFINEAPAAIAMLDRNLCYIAASKSWLKDYSLTNSNIIGRSHYEVFPEIPERWREVNKRCLAGATESAQDELFIRSDGSKHWVSWEARPWISGNSPNEIGGIVIFAEDVTQRIKARENELAERLLRSEAERALRIKDEFVATLSHELRSPLNAMLDWTQLLKRLGNDPSRINQAVRAIESSGQVLTQLISDILDLNRISSGKLKLDKKEFSINSLIERSIEIILPDAQAKEVLVEARLFDTDSFFQGDPVRLQQCLWNILSNAIKFTPSGGRITLSVEKTSETLELSITDTGCGIEPNLLPHIFERFVQADTSSTRVHGGLGLGLAITKHLVELHGGSVSAESAGRGQGSRFTISLPLETQQSSSLPNSAPLSENNQLTSSSNTLAGISVLVVDDHLDARELLRGTLEDNGARVVTASCSKSALEIASKHPTDIIISDIAMPYRDGCALIADLRAKGLSTPTIALSAYASDNDKERALNAGFNRYLTKPVQLERLFQTVRELSHHQSTVSEMR